MDFLKGFIPTLSSDRNHIQINALSSSTILQVANEINGLLIEKELEHDDLILPRIVVIGAQSSGKTSILNNIISMDILPMGEEMVTRVPLELQLHQLLKDNNKNWVEFWNKDSNSRVCNIDVSFPITKLESDKIKSIISDETNKFAGLEKDRNINTKAIVMKIYSQHVPNLSLTDLPGIISTPHIANIKEKIDNIAISYMNKPKTIVLAVAQSKKDLETDIGLGLIKQIIRKNSELEENEQNINIKNIKIIGVLTKPDLMSKDTHIGNYLSDHIPDYIKVNNGYFVVKCRDNNERQSLSVAEGYSVENSYFNSHSEYRKQAYKGKIGTNNLVTKLTEILLQDIKVHLPKALLKLVELEKTISIELNKLGEIIPNDTNGKLGILNTYVSTFCQSLITGMTEGTLVFNAPVAIKTIFYKFRNELRCVKPFSDTTIYNDEYFNLLKSNMEGNHMTSYVSSIRLVEHCIQDNNYQPLKPLLDLSQNATNDVIICIKNLVEAILNDSQFSKYKKLTTYIKSIISDEFLPALQLSVNKKINELINCYKVYVWTEDEEFTKMISTNSPPNVLLGKYFETVTYMIQDIVPKYIMLGVVHVISQSINTYLYSEIINKGKIEYVHEDDEVKLKRYGYVIVLDRIANIKNQFNRSGIKS